MISQMIGAGRGKNRINVSAWASAAGVGGCSGWRVPGRCRYAWRGGNPGQPRGRVPRGGAAAWGGLQAASAFEQVASGQGFNMALGGFLLRAALAAWARRDLDGSSALQPRPLGAFGAALARNCFAGAAVAAVVQFSLRRRTRSSDAGLRVTIDGLDGPGSRTF